MKNLMNKIRKANKGFTLVELIIVVAIIAILTAVAAPQYIKYVEKSRIAKDDNNIGSIRTAIETAIVDNNSDADANNNISNCGTGETFTVTFNTDGISTTDAKLQDALEETLGGTFDANTNVNPILKVTQTTDTSFGIKFTAGKFDSIT